MSLPKVALITAGSAGLGAAVARVLALELGMSVVINYSQNASRAQALVHELQKSYKATSDGAKPSYHAIQADLSKKENVKRLAQDAATAAGGRLDVVVSNVGWTKVRDFMSLDDGMDEEDWDSCLDVNVKSHLWLFHAARPFLEESNARDEGGAVFVSTASVAGVKPSGSSLVCHQSSFCHLCPYTNHQQPYAVSKAAQIHLIKSLALIAAPTIRVNSVSPGLLMTVGCMSIYSSVFL